MTLNTTDIFGKQTISHQPILHKSIEISLKQTKGHLARPTKIAKRSKRNGQPPATVKKIKKRKICQRHITQHHMHMVG